MPSLSELPSDINRAKFTRALIRLGFMFNKVGGKGSHSKIEWPLTRKSVTVIDKMRKDTLYYLLKEIEEISGITWEKIKKEMHLK